MIQNCSEKPLENEICVFKYVGEDFRGQVNNAHLFFTVLKAEKYNIKMPVDLVFGESPVPGS